MGLWARQKVGAARVLGCIGLGCEGRVRVRV